MISYVVFPFLKVSLAINYLHDKASNILSKIVARIYCIGIFIFKSGIVAGLYLIHPHGFFWTATITFFFFDRQFNEIDQAVKQLYSKIIFNPNFPVYTRFPIFFTAVVFVIYDHPDWLTLFSFLCAGKIGASLRQMIRDNEGQPI